MNGKSISLWVLTLSLVGVFCAAGAAKLVDAPQMVDAFQKFGYSNTFRLLVGAGEISAAALLLFPRSASAGAWFLTCIMLGAMGTHLTHHEYAQSLIPVGLGMLCLVVAFARRPAAMRKSYVMSMKELDRLWELERQFESIKGGRY